MILKDLIVHVNNVRGNRTFRNTYINGCNYSEIINEIRRDKKYSMNWYVSAFYLKKENFTISSNNDVEINCCQIKYDIGENYNEVLTESERIIKEILE